jgi:hypothetical protein
LPVGAGRYSPIASAGYANSALTASQGFWRPQLMAAQAYQPQTINKIGQF